AARHSRRADPFRRAWRPGTRAGRRAGRRHRARDCDCRQGAREGGCAGKHDGPSRSERVTRVRTGGHPLDGRDHRRRSRALSITSVRLDPRRPYKPLDIGNGIVSGYLTAGGRWLELGIAHRRHGRVVVSDTPSFIPAATHDQQAVRAYRAALASTGRAGFGLDALGPGGRASLQDDSFPGNIRIRAGLHIAVTSFAPQGRRGAAQVIRLRAESPTRFAPAWTGTMFLHRAAYTQLTPGGPLPAVEERPTTGRDERGAWIADEGLEVACGIVTPAPLTLAPGDEAVRVVALAFAPTADEALAEASSLATKADALLTQLTEARRSLWTGLDVVAPRHAPLRRAVAYSLDCASSEVGDATAVRAADRLPNARPALCGRARPRRARVARATQRDRAYSHRGDARGRSDRGTVPLLEPRAAVAPAPRSRSRSGTDSPRPHAPSLRDRRHVRVRGARRRRRWRDPLSRRERPPDRVRAGVALLPRERSTLARDDRIRVVVRESRVRHGTAWRARLGAHAAPVAARGPTRARAQPRPARSSARPARSRTPAPRGDVGRDAAGGVRRADRRGRLAPLVRLAHRALGAARARAASRRAVTPALGRRRRHRRVHAPQESARHRRKQARSCEAVGDRHA